MLNESLATILEKYLINGDPSAAILAVDDNRYNSSLNHSCSDEIATVFKFLNDEIFTRDLNFYSACEEILKAIARRSNEDEVLFELLEIIETTKSDNIFISALKGLQISLLNQKTHRSRSLEWCFNSIYTYFSQLPLPKKIKNELEEDEAKLIEINEHIERILTLYLTLFLFIEPIRVDILKAKTISNFRNTENTKDNVLACFLLQLMGPPFAYLEIVEAKEKVGKSYSMQCAEGFASGFSSIIIDPFQFLQYIERDIIQSDEVTTKSDSTEKNKNVFLNEEKTPILSICIYYYLLFAENLMPQNIPKIYKKQYIFENCLLLVNKLLKYTEGSLIYKGLKFGDSLVDFLGDRKIIYKELAKTINLEFCNSLANISILSEVKRNRKKSIELLKNYIFKFNDEGRFEIIKNIFQIEQFKTLHGYFSIIYKDIIAEYLNVGLEEIPQEFSNDKFKMIMLNYVCLLRNGVTTDLMENADQIISALNVITFLIIRDINCKTSIWNNLNEINNNFVKPLQNALDLSKAHYHVEITRVTNGDELPDKLIENTIECQILNGFEFPKLTKEQKLTSLKYALNTFDIMDSLLARCNDVIKLNHDKIIIMN